MSAVHLARVGLMYLYGAGQLSSPSYIAQGTTQLRHVDLPLTWWPLRLLLVAPSPPTGSVHGFLIGRLTLWLSACTIQFHMLKLQIVQYRELGTVLTVFHPWWSHCFCFALHFWQKWNLNKLVLQEPYCQFYEGYGMVHSVTVSELRLHDQEKDNFLCTKWRPYV